MIKLKHDGELHIFTGKSRIIRKEDKSTYWHNEEITWSKLVTRLTTTKRTPERFVAYMGLEKRKQDQVKDVGGFIGGHFKGTQRKKKDLLYRELITLDIDDYGNNFWTAYELSEFGDYAACIYTTHKHSSAKPRYRLVIPLSRGVMDDEYQAISRKIADRLGLGKYKGFDRSTFDYSRLMYWPSTSSDGEFIGKYIDAPWLDPDMVLGMYEDWKDISSWPFKSKTDDISYKNKAKLQEDPREKQGWVGAFCRAYDVHQAIQEFLPDTYTQSDISDDRYTYNQGSTSNGMVVYDDGLYCFSNHGTDPARGRLCNAFDLVRLHKFGLHDKPEDNDTPAHKTASYQKMLDWCPTQKQVKKALLEMKMKEVSEDFKGLTGDGEVDLSDILGESNLVPNSDWMEKLEVGKTKGKQAVILDTRDNLVLILDNELKGAVGDDLLMQRRVVRKNLPWRTVKKGKYWTDTDDSQLRKLVESKYEINNASKVDDALRVIADKNAFHPIKQYVEAIKWDGTERVEELLIDFFGAEDSEYVRQVMRKTLVGAIARVYNPGCKFDTMPVLIGKQGTYKSTFWKKLGGEWFSESFSFHLIGSGNKAVEQIVGYWIVEIGEMTGMKKAEQEGVKQFLARTKDDVRMAYAKNVATYLRQNIFVGSTNNDEFLTDDSGNRRYWPVKLGQSEPMKHVWFDLDSIVGQIWAEAKYYYDQGEELKLPNHLDETAKEIQAMHMEYDPRQEMLEAYLDTPIPDDFRTWNIYKRREYLFQTDELAPTHTGKKRHKIMIHEIAEELLKMKIEEINSFNTKPIHAMMSKLKGWKKTTVKINKIARPGYIRTDSSTIDISFLN